MTEVYRVKEAFAFDDEHGVPVVLRMGALLNADDPRVKGHERYLEPAQDAASRTSTVPAVETATAEPGERRSLSAEPGSAQRRGRAAKAPSSS